MESLKSLMGGLEVVRRDDSAASPPSSLEAQVEVDQWDRACKDHVIQESPSRYFEERNLETDNPLYNIPKDVPLGPRSMSVSHSLVWKRPSGKVDKADDAEFRRKKLKVSDLPISGAQRSAIDGLLLTFKKSGEFDKLRKSIFAQFEGSVCGYIGLGEATLTGHFLGCEDQDDEVDRGLDRDRN